MLFYDTEIFITRLNVVAYPEEDICYSQKSTLWVKKKSGTLTGDPETVIELVNICVSPQTTCHIYAFRLFAKTFLRPHIFNR